MSEKNENLTTNVQLNETENGTVSFATDVIATIAGLAATEVEGVASKLGSGMGLVDMLRKNQGNRALTRGVKVETDGNRVICQVSVTVEYGIPVPDIARDIQDNVKRAIENMTGLVVPEINIYIQGISFEKENKAVAELEQRQQAALNPASDDKTDDADSEKKRFRLSDALGKLRSTDEKAQGDDADGEAETESKGDSDAEADADKPAERADADTETVPSDKIDG